MTKNNERIWRWSKILVPIILASAVVVFGYGRLDHRVETLETQAKEAQETKEIVIRIEADVKNIKEAVARIESWIDDRE